MTHLEVMQVFYAKYFAIFRLHSILCEQTKPEEMKGKKQIKRHKQKEYEEKSFFSDI